LNRRKRFSPFQQGEKTVFNEGCLTVILIGRGSWPAHGHPNAAALERGGLGHRTAYSGNLEVFVPPSCARAWTIVCLPARIPCTESVCGCGLTGTHAPVYRGEIASVCVLLAAVLLFLPAPTRGVSASRGIEPAARSRGNLCADRMSTSYLERRFFSVLRSCGWCTVLVRRQAPYKAEKTWRR